ncbi:MarR family winged helix-turn-helix transcriptional regulator [Streptomyces chiangmaiensis]|uniref:MarR family transcriptional regulator n=1 Tax=Streptomyces chiangmaiensis TaxID=766497 RepID=A0ABU7FT74_9ACTN|nr:MarR family transcriptional regulator [Streptomyces chiangmaiensis]MED7827173.1 MarR family transcriptional regulator [Streptomyces chiangmaiensis]
MTPERLPTSTHQPRWLTPAELETWYSFCQLLYMLPTALGAQLQRDAQLSFVEYYVLAGLSDQPERRMRMSDLAVLANSELSRLSHLINRLEKRGYVRREPDPTNGRYTHAILTDAGYAHLVEAAPGHVARVRKLVYDVLDPTELRGLRTVADKIIDRIEQDDCPPKDSAMECRP